MPDSPPTYRIHRWDEVFENNRTRELKTMTWGAVPCEQGDGYTQIAAERDGAAIYGVWIAIAVQVASRCRPRGVLSRRDGSPHVPSSIARLIRFRLPIVKRAWHFLIDIGWLEPCVISQDGATISQDGAPRARVQSGREGKGRSKTPLDSPQVTKRDATPEAAGGGDASPGRKTGKPCSECTDGAILVNGKIVRCCGCPKGYARAKALRSAKRAEGRSMAERASRGPDEPREVAPPSSEGRELILGPDTKEMFDPDTGRVLPVPKRRSK